MDNLLKRRPDGPVARLAPRVRVARTTAELDALADPWDGMLAAVPDAMLSQTWQYARTAWTAVHEPAGRRLAVVTVWQGDQLDLVWPLQIEDRRGYSIVSQLGNTSDQEYALPAARPGLDARQALVLATIVAQRLGDVLTVRHVPGEPLPLAQSRLPRWLTFQATTTSHVAVRPADGGFDAWLKDRPQKLRWEMRRNRRRLAEAGELRAFSSDDPDEGGIAAGHEAIGWIFEHKRRWLAARGLKRDWISNGTAEGFFHELLDDVDPAAARRLVVVGLRLDGAIVSASICYRSARVLEGFVIAFDESLPRLGPGNVLMEECVHRAFDDGLDFDFRIDPFAYKLRWTDTEVVHHTQLVPCTVRGVPYVASNHVRRARQAAGRAVAPWLARRLPTATKARAQQAPRRDVARALARDVSTAAQRRRKGEDA